MEKKKALIVWGGWNGHHPELIASIFQQILEESGFAVESRFDLGAFSDLEKLKELDLIIPHWTMGSIEDKLVDNVSEAVASGVGLAGCHGGMCDAFRGSVLWQFLTGGTWVSHPGGDLVDHTIQIREGEGHLLSGITNFRVSTEQYYLHVDPANEVLATCRFPNPVARDYHSANPETDMPVVWTRKWAAGRVFYCSLGHHPLIFDIPECREIMRRGFLHAAEGKDAAGASGLSGKDYRTGQRMI